MNQILRSLITPLCLFCLAYFSTSSYANQNEYFFFETDWGEEIKVKISGTYDAPEYIIHASTISTAQELTRQFVKSTMQRRNYRYEFGTCFDCEVSYYGSQKEVHESSSAIIEGASAEATKKTIISKTDLANKALENVATSLGTRVVDAVFTKSVENKTVNTSPFTVVVGQDNRPILLCKVTSDGTCKTLDNVLLTNFEKGGWGASFPYSSRLGSAERALARQIEDALLSIGQLRYTCNVTYTGIHGETMVANVVCFLSY